MGYFFQKNGYNDPSLVADPINYGQHNITLNAIDIIPSKLDGTKIELPCEFDDFSEKSRIDYNKCPQKAKNNRDLLINIAQKYGLIVNPKEWWHFSDKNIFKNGLNYNYKNTNLIPTETEKAFNISK